MFKLTKEALGLLPLFVLSAFGHAPVKHVVPPQIWAYNHSALCFMNDEARQRANFEDADLALSRHKTVIAFQAYYRAMFCDVDGVFTIDGTSLNSPALPLIAEALQCASSGHLSSCVGKISSARSLDKTSIEAAYFAGAIAWAMGDLSQARRLWTDALKINRSNSYTSEPIKIRASAIYFLRYER